MTETPSPTRKHQHHYETHHRGTQVVPYDGLIGVTHDGVPVMSNGDEDHFSNVESLNPAYLPLSSFDKSCAVPTSYLKLGYKWDSMEFVRRYLASRKAIWIAPVSSAEDLWNANDLFTRITDGAAVQFSRTCNRSVGAAPAMGDIVVWGRSEEVPFGHVAIVVEVHKKMVRIAEQNQGFERWSSDALYSRELPLHIHGDDGVVELIDRDPVLGWVSVEVPFCGFAEDDVADQFRLIVGPGEITRHGVAPRMDVPWLREEEKCDFYLKRSLMLDKTQPLNGGVAAEVDVPNAFYYLDYNMWCRIGRAARSLHRIALEATAKVLSDPDATHLLEHYFGLPPELEPLLRRAWEQTPPMCGRFDFGYDGKRIRMLEYNCDSSAALLECCDTQEKMAQFYGVTEGMSTGAFWGAKCRRYFEHLIKDERLCPRHKLIHFMIDDDDEERYTAMCVMQFAEAAGFRTRLCVNLADFCFADENERGVVNTLRKESALYTAAIVDRDGEDVEMVWKTWSWDTVLHRYETEKQADLVATAPRRKPTLPDVLLNASIRVLEPLWKTITGSKAILPFMYALAPDHQNMLPASFMRTKEIISTYHLSKPVNGRAGQNITMFDPVNDEDELNEAPSLGLDGAQSPTAFSHAASFALSIAPSMAISIDRENESSAGKFFDSVVVYQQRLFLKRYEHRYFPIFCGWMLGDEFAGVVVREDTSRITKLGSVVVPARVVREAAASVSSTSSSQSEEET